MSFARHLKATLLGILTNGILHDELRKAFGSDALASHCGALKQICAL